MVTVALHRGALIEILRRLEKVRRWMVALHRGALIEIEKDAKKYKNTLGRTPQGCVD